MTLHIIHLPARADRLNLLQAELTEQHIQDYKIWDGIVDPEKICRGISRAHKQIVADAKSKGLPNALIAEDDLHFTAPGAYEFFLRKIPSDYDLYLGGVIWGKIKKDNRIDDFSGTTLYLVHEKFYDELLSVPEETDFDRALAHRGNFFVCNPQVVVQHSGFSDNQKRYIHFRTAGNGITLYGQ